MKDTVYRELPGKTVTTMNQQRTFVAALAERHQLGCSVTGTRADYDLLGLILSKKCSAMP